MTDADPELVSDTVAKGLLEAEREAITDLVGVSSPLWEREEVLERLGAVDFVAVANPVEVFDTEDDPVPVRLTTLV